MSGAPHDHRRELAAFALELAGRHKPHRHRDDGLWYCCEHIGEDVLHPCREFEIAIALLHVLGVDPADEEIASVASLADATRVVSGIVFPDERMARVEAAARAAMQAIISQPGHPTHDLDGLELTAPGDAAMDQAGGPLPGIPPMTREEAAAALADFQRRNPHLTVTGRYRRELRERDTRVPPEPVGPPLPGQQPGTAYAVPGERCPDGGGCHHGCTYGCFRVTFASPLSAAGWGDTWPPEVTAAYRDTDGHL